MIVGVHERRVPISGVTGRGECTMPRNLSDSPDPSDTPLRHGEVVDRRSGLDRRDLEHAKPGSTGLERRRGPGRRLADSLKSAEEGEMSKEQFLFLLAIDEFKRANHKTFPSWTDVLEVIRLLGYRKTCRASLTLANAEDWTEKPDAPANVRREKK